MMERLTLTRICDPMSELMPIPKERKPLFSLFWNDGGQRTCNHFLGFTPSLPHLLGLLFPAYSPSAPHWCRKTVSCRELVARLGFCKWPHLVLNFCFPSAFGKHCCILISQSTFNIIDEHSILFPVQDGHCFVLRNKDGWLFAPFGPTGPCCHS